MTLNRRNFLRTSLSGAALAVGSTALASCSSKSANTAKGEKGSDKPGKDLELKLSFQEGIAPGESLGNGLFLPFRRLVCRGFSFSLHGCF